MTLGHVCLRIGRIQCALDVFALVMGLRGAQMYVCKAMARTLCALAPSLDSHRRNVCCCIARSFAVCALQSCPPMHRMALAREFVEGQLVSNIIDNSTSFDGVSEQTLMSWDDVLTREAALAIILTLQKRGGAASLASRIPAYMDMARQYLSGASSAWMTCHEESIETTWSSVRTL